MFYSHQLLARKAPLGQIWMAATMHAKMNRKKLDKLNLIKICEEILNPSVPMALRLSGILMGGVVIVYERKVKLLYDDVTRFMIEINEAWKVKAIPDPTVLPEGKSHAKYEAVTLPNNEDMEVGEIEESLHFSDTTNRMKFQQAGYFTMRLDDVDEPYVNEDPKGDDLSLHCHQADAANITLMDNIDSYQADTDLYNRFERFDIEGDEEDVQLNYTLREYSQVPITLVPSPPRQDENPQADEIQDQHPETEAKQQSDESKEASQPQQDIKRRLPLKRKARTRAPQLAMDYEQTIIPGHVYQSWLTNPSGLVSKRGVRTRKRINPMSTMKVTNLMELPPVALSCGLFVNETREIYYPAPLLELWMRSTQFQPAHDGQKSPPQPPAPSSSAAPDGLYQGLFEYSVEDFHSGVGSQQWKPSREKLRTNLKNVEVPENFENNLNSIGVAANESNLMVTPGNSGGSVRSTAELPMHSGRRPYSSSKHSGSSLDPVAEDIPWLANNEPAFKLARLSENGSTPEHDLLVETGPTQTQYPVVHYPIDKITDTIRSHLKTHFDTPGAPQTESLFQLASGMNRRKATQLFYQTCVLTSHGYLRVEQRVPYGDIFMSKGPKM